MSSRKQGLNTALFRPKDEIDHEQGQMQSTGDMTPAPERRYKRASFDLYEDQLVALSEIRTKLWRETGVRPKVSELAREAFDLLIEKHG
jgi:hypothetical protein